MNRLRPTTGSLAGDYRSQNSVSSVIYKMDYSPEFVNQLQDDLVALIGAWSDRGVPPSDAAMFLMASAHFLALKTTPLTFTDIMEIARNQWESHGGKI